MYKDILSLTSFIVLLLGQLLILILLLNGTIAPMVCITGQLTLLFLMITIGILSE